MKYWLSIFCVFGLVGCGSVPETYVAGDRKTYDAVVNDYELFVRSRLSIDPATLKVQVYSNGDPILSDDETTDLKLLTIRTWRYRLEAAEKDLAGTAEVTSQ